MKTFIHKNFGDFNERATQTLYHEKYFQKMMEKESKRSGIEKIYSRISGIEQIYTRMKKIIKSESESESESDPKCRP